MTDDLAAVGREAWVRSAVGLLVLGLVLFVPAGSLRFWQAWVYGFVFVSGSIAMSVYFLKRDPKLIERRMRAGPAAEQEPTQKIIMTIILIEFLLLLVVPGFDHRWHWSAVPARLVFAANAGIALSFCMFFVVLKQNSFAASTIRVEANQPVISTGVYAIVRHPLYSAALPLLICTPVALGSYWGLLVALAAIPVLAWRLLDEERFLRENLPGYADYCRATRFRLIPGIW